MIRQIYASTAELEFMLNFARANSGWIQIQETPGSIGHTLTITSQPGDKSLTEVPVFRLT